MSHSPEQLQGAPERLNGAQEAAGERAEALKNRFESVGESSPEQSQEKIESARHETESIFAKEAGKESRQGGEPSGMPAVIRRITKREKKRIYKETLSHAQSQMRPVTRTFSKVIHSPFVEKSSDIVGSTIARPNAILFGSATALILLSLLYVVARVYGYKLSGFEMIGAYGLGWAIGLIIDYAKTMLATR